MKIRRLDQVDSTNDEAKRLFLAGQLRDITLICAHEQTAGRGTQGRSWISPSGAGIYLTLVFPGIFPGVFKTPLPLSTAYTQAAGLACAQTLQEQLGLRVHLKPVNDLYVEGRKLGGILTETLIQESQIRALLIGVGLNVLKAHRPLNDDRAVPISLEECLPPFVFTGFNQAVFEQALAECLIAWVERFSHGDTLQSETAKLEALYNQYVLI